MIRLAKKKEAAAAAAAADAAALVTESTSLSSSSSASPSVKVDNNDKDNIASITSIADGSDPNIVSLFGIAGKKVKQDNDSKKPTKKRTPGEIRIQKGAIMCV